MAEDREITVFGDGSQTRDFTFVDDIVRANISALRSGRPGETYNIGGGHRETLAEVIRMMEAVSGTKARVRREEKQKGDVPDTWADIRKAEKIWITPQKRRWKTASNGNGTGFGTFIHPERRKKWTRYGRTQRLASRRHSV